MAKRLFDGLCSAAVDHIAARDLINEDGKEVASFVPSWLEIRYQRARCRSFDEPGLRFALRLQNGDAFRTHDFLTRVGNLPPEIMGWLQDHAPASGDTPAKPYIGRDGRRLPAAARCYLPRHDPTVVAGMEGLILLEEFNFATMEQLLEAKYSAKSFTDATRKVLKPHQFERALYIGVKLTVREDGTVGPLGFVLALRPYLRDEGEHVRVVRDGALVYLYPEAVETLAEAHNWAVWECPAAMVHDDEETLALPASTGDPALTSGGGSG